MLRLADLLEAAAAEQPVVLSSGAEVFSAIAHDSRNVEPGELFVAIRTAHGDGHSHIEEALARGAGGLLVERWPEPWGADVPAPVTTVVVRSTGGALRAWARWRLRRATTVAVMGSLGKSTAQAALRLAWAGAAAGQVYGVGDRNDSLGIPVALGSLPPSASRIVLEVVAGSTSERRQVREMCRPQVVGVTTTLDADQLWWRSATELAASVEELVDEGAIMVLPAAEAAIFRASPNRPRVTFGPLGSAADLELGPDPNAPAPQWPRPWSLLVVAKGASWRVQCPLHPVVAATSWAPALACVLALGLEVERGIPALASSRPLPGRLRLWPGRGGGTVVDDSFDASPASTELAVSALAQLPPPRLACVGPGTAPLLAPATVVAAGTAGVRLVVPEETLGPSAAPPEAAEVLPLGDVVASARTVLSAGGTVLVKGVAQQRLERVTAALVAADSELVRQDRGRRLMAFRSPRRPTWVEVDLEALAANVAEIATELGPTRLMAVVKADAYGHGAVQVARAALSSGATWVATATLAEAAELRRRGIDAPLLVLGYTPPELVEPAQRLGLALTVFDEDVLEALDRAGERLGVRARAHLKVDTGMSRLGVAPERCGEIVTLARSREHLELEGIYTHFRKGQDDQAVRDQMERFELALGLAERAGHRFRIRHAANSAAWKHAVSARLDMVRLGGELLGLMTADGRRRRPVLSFKTTVAQIRRIARGTHVGYGDAFTAPAEMTVATLPVGYGDGFRRGPRNFETVLIRGRHHRLVGDVSMDMCMVDVTADPAISRGDEVVIIGRQGAAEISAEDVARRVGTINYEVVTQILPRVPREAIGWVGNDH